MTLDPRAAMHLSETAVSIELETGDMTLNIGPQHPSTHGVLRLVAKVDGERVHDVQPVIGYMHRGYEKISEVRTYAQITALLNRIDWVSGFANEIAFVTGVEKLMDLEVPERAQYIRMILTELTRISSHLVFMSSYPLELGAATPLMHSLREREHVLDLLEGVTGGRFHPNFNRIGGVKPALGQGSATKKVSQDLPAGFLQGTRDAMARVLAVCDDLDDLVTGNELFQARTVGVGVIPPAKAIEYGLSGPNLRASGVDFDLRKKGEVVLPYDKVEFDVPLGENGDCYDRYVVRRDPPVHPHRQPRRRHHSLRPAEGKGSPSHQSAGRPGVHAGRESQGRDGVLHHFGRGDDPLPRQDQVGVVQQPLHPPVGSRGHAHPGPRSHHG